MKAKHTLIAAILAFAISGTASASSTSMSPVIWFSDFTDTGGQSRLTRTDSMILMVLEAANLIPGDAYTIWFVVFNNPDGCSAPCDGDDLTPEGIIAANIGVGHATGNVARADGTTEFGGRLVRNENLPGHHLLFGAGFSSEYVLTADPAEVEVHLIVQTHGQARGGSPLLNQLTFFEANCTPECEDIQAAVHLP